MLQWVNGLKIGAHSAACVNDCLHAVLSHSPLQEHGAGHVKGPLTSCFLQGTRDGWHQGWSQHHSCQPQRVAGKSVQHLFPMQKPKVFLHVQRLICAHHVSSQHNSDDRSFAEELDASVCQKGDKNGIKQFPTAKCHIDGTSIFGKASVNFNILFCFLKISTTQKMSKYVILTFSEPNVLSLHS